MKRIAIFMLLILALVGCRSKPIPTELQGATLYTKVNIFVDRSGDSKASYAVYTTRDVLPINTAVQITGNWRSGFIMTVVSSGEKIHYEYSDKRMKWSMTEYINMITSPNKTILKLPSLDMKNVEKGTVVPGMTKDGVIAALGYPPSHKTPSLDDATWTYWTNRFTTRVVTFDSKGIVTNVNAPF